MRGKTIAVLGLAFKPKTDDMRDAPSISIVTALDDAGAKVRAFDPESMDQARLVMPNAKFCESAYDCITGADAVTIVTEWDEFRALDLSRVKSLMGSPIMIDLRNIYRPADSQAARF